MYYIEICPVSVVVHSTYLILYSSSTSYCSSSVPYVCFSFCFVRKMYIYISQVFGVRKRFICNTELDAYMLTVK